MPLQPGQVLNNRYRIVKLLGQGGFGAVYRAWDTNLSRPCAVKENLDTSPEAQRQFSREATVLANLSHPNLPRVTDHFSLPDQGQYLVMDFVDGEDLATKLHNAGPLPIENALVWVVQVAEALSYLHSRQPTVIHRDIKPANIRITPANELYPMGKAMLVDFGLVKASAPNLKTTVGARAVTPGYAPPEQYGQGTTDNRTDLYALGATLYALLTNQQPLDSLQRMMGKKLTPIQQYNPQVPPLLGQVIERVMSLDAKQRYQTADDFKAALAISIPTLPGNATLFSSSEATLISQAPPEITSRQPPSAPFTGGDQQPVVQHVARPEPPRYRSAAEPSVGRGESSSQAAPAYPGTPMPGAPAARRGSAARPPRQAAARKGTGKKTLFWVVVLGLIVLCIGSLIGLFVYITQSSGSGLSDSDFQATMDERVLLTSTARAELTAAAGEQSGPETPAGPDATEQARNQILDDALANRTSVLGPEQGSLAHDPSTSLIAGKTMNVDLHNFVIEVRFYNPYAASQASWDYGLLFRHLGPNEHLRLIIRSDKVIVLMNNTGAPDGAVLQEFNVPDLNTDEGGWNLVMLICQADRGYVYLNKVFVAELDLSARTNSGDVAVVTGTYEGDQVSGEFTDFQDLYLWSLP